MSNKILYNFKEFAKQVPNQRIKEKIKDVCKEDDLNYVADELLFLIDEILIQVSSFGVCLYLKQNRFLKQNTNQINNYKNK